jgi:hypothetical protein
LEGRYPCISIWISPRMKIKSNLYTFNSSVIVETLQTKLSAKYTHKRTSDGLIVYKGGMEIAQILGSQLPYPPSEADKASSFHVIH